MITYPDSVRFLYSLGNEIKTVKMGLDRIRVVLHALGNPERACRWIHVAGTNGKGSTCAMMEAGLRAAGHRTGLYISPHLVEPTERIRINGTEVSSDEFAQAFHRIHEISSCLIDSESIDGHPTYFETVTAMAFLLFRDRGIETGVIEVGLGGRLDATNVITPALSVITPIDFDHEAWLGNSLHAIAGEKAGIVKPGVPVVLAPQRPEAHARLIEAAAACQSPVIHAGGWPIHDLHLHPAGSRFRTGPTELSLHIECNLAGSHQVDNARTAAVALHNLGIPQLAIQDGIRQARWPGRLERISTNPDIILDGAHNPAGIRALAAHIERFFHNRTVWIIYSTMRDKSVDEIGELLSGVASHIILTSSDSARSLRPEVLRPFFPHPDVRTAPRLQQAFEIAQEAAPGDVIFISGSLFLVGEARAMLAKLLPVG